MDKEKIKKDADKFNRYLLSLGKDEKTNFYTALQQNSKLR
jgi:hypothetical protein